MKVSVCIPTYKQVEYLRDTLQSLEAQTFSDYEVIISDDSPDDCVRNLLSEFTFGDRLRYVKNTPALGSPENWNAAIRLGHGEYIKILHHDDQFVSPDALQKFVRLLDDNPEADFAFSATIVNHVDTGIQRPHCPTSRQLAELEADPASLFVGNCVGAPSVTICRRSSNLWYDTRMKWLVDIDYYFRILMRNSHFAFTPEALIKTPTSANHQVTELCRDNGEIELQEALLMFEKFSIRQRDNPLVKQGWSILFRRFKMSKLDDFARYGLPVPKKSTELGSYYLTLMKQHYSILYLLLDPPLLVRKIFYRLYPHVPAPVRRSINYIYNFFNLH